MKLLHGDLAAQLVSERIGEPVATVAALGALPNSRCVNGQIFYVLADGSRWQFNTASALTADNILVAGAATGRFLRMPGAVDLKLPITFATADAAVLLTMQAGSKLLIRELFWEITTTFAGGTASAIGVSSNKTTPTSWVAKGDLLGGVGGDLTATLVSTAVGGLVAGTVGVDFDTIAKRRGALWVAADNLLFDRIASVYTSGVGFVHVVGDLIANAGA